MRTWLPSLAAVLLAAAPARGDVGEQWYLLRARANMQIKNYKAAIEAYRKALEKNSKNREALKGLAVAYEANGQTDEAIGAYDRYLARYSDDAEAAFKQAHVLEWSRYKYRREDAIRYYRMGLAQRDDPNEGRKLAKLLAQDKATLDETLAEYRILLDKSPDEAEMRSEYRKLLLWDARHLQEAIREYSRLADERPSDRAVSLQLARLLAQDDRRLPEAIERYRHLVDQSPSDQSLRVEYGRVLARDPSHREDALTQLQAVHGKDFETRRFAAQLLAGEPDRRPKAVSRYRALLQEQPADDHVRLEYARLLGAERETTPEAIREYETVLAHQPENAEAQAGLARAYAWNGDNDRALYYGHQAISHGRRDPELRELEWRLGIGREPRLGGGASLLVQQGGKYGLLGFRFPAVAARSDVTPFGTVSAQVGFEWYQDPAGAQASGGFFSAESEVRFAPGFKLRAGLSYQTMRVGVMSWSGLAELDLSGSSTDVRIRFVREPRTDSLRALVGSLGGATPGGGVSTNETSLRVQKRIGDLRLYVEPRLAVLNGIGADVNLEPSLGAGVSLRILAADAVDLSLGYDAQVAHYGHDASAPTTGGYFSPDVYLVNTPYLGLRFQQPGRRIELDAGPSLQYQLLHDGTGGWIPGGVARASGTFSLASHLEMTLSGALTRVGDAYVRYDAGLSLSYVF